MKKNVAIKDLKDYGFKFNDVYCSRRYSENNIIADDVEFVVNKELDKMVEAGLIEEKLNKEEIVIYKNKALLNINELCDYLGVGQTKARELLRDCNGFGVQIGNRWYANKKKLDEWLDKESL